MVREVQCDKTLEPHLWKGLMHDVVHDGMILNYVFINLIADADTTAITLRAVLIFLMRHPGTLKKLQAEIPESKFDTKVAQFT